MSKNKKFILGLFIGLLLAGGMVILAAPVGTVLRSVIPETNNTYYLGTTSPKTYWANVYTQVLTVTSGTATTTINAGDTIPNFAYPFSGIDSTLNATTSGLRIASSSVLGVLNVGILNATSSITTNNLTVNGTCTGCSSGINSGTINRLAYYSGATTLDSLNSVVINALNASSTWNVLNVGTLVATSTITAPGGMTLTCTGCLTDANVVDTITLTNITQITNRAITDLTGTLTVGNGGTGATTFTSNGVLYGNGTGIVQVTGQGGANTVLTANAGAPSFSSSPTITNLTVTASSTLQAVNLLSATTTKLDVLGSFATPPCKDNSGSSYTVNWSNCSIVELTLNAANVDIILNSTSSSPQSGGRYILKILQDGTGSRVVNWATPGNLRWWAGTTTLTTTANRCGWLGMIYSSTKSTYTILASSTPLLASDC